MLCSYPQGSGGGLNLDIDDVSTYSSTDGSGGGLVYIGAGGNLLLDGEISVDGMTGGVTTWGSLTINGGGGSGGSVKIFS